MFSEEEKCCLWMAFIVSYVDARILDEAFPNFHESAVFFPLYFPRHPNTGEGSFNKNIKQKTW